MPYTKEQVLDALLEAVVETAAEAEPDQDGHVPEDVQDRVDQLAALAKEPALSRLVGELNESTEMAHAPAGYTHDHPLMIQGHAYVGGEFIPGDVLAKATAEEKGAVEREPPAKEEKVSKPMSARAKQILQEVSAIKFSDVVVDAGDYDSFDSIEERMTEEEIAEMETALEDSKEAYIDQEMGNFEPEVDEDDMANGAGYSHQNIEDHVNDLIDEHVDDEDEAEVLKQAVQDWPSHGVGDGAISRLKRELRLAAGQADESFELPEALADALDEYETTAEEEIKTATEEEKDSQLESRRESLGERYDNDNNDRADYLREFWEDHQDRYQGKIDCGDKTWCKDADGDDNLTFKTSDGTEYLVRAITTQREYEGEPVADLQFADSEGSFSVTGAGSAFEVFSNVVPAMTAWIKERQPKVTTFSAAEPSRQKLYDRLVRTVTGVLPDYFGAAVQSPGGGRYYFVGKRSEKEKLMEFVKSIKQGELHEFGMSDGDEVVITELKPEVNPDWWTSKGWEDLFPELSKTKPKDLSHPAPLPDTVPTFYERLRAEVRARRRAVEMATDDEEGHWVTIGSHAKEDEEDAGKQGGTRVFIKGGKIVKGPKHMIGKAPHELKEKSSGKSVKQSQTEVDKPVAKVDTTSVKETKPKQEKAMQTATSPKPGDTKAGWTVAHVLAPLTPHIEVDAKTGKRRQIEGREGIVIAEHPEEGGREFDPQEWEELGEGPSSDATVLDAMREIEPQADQSAMVPTVELREHLKDQLPDKEFDAAIIGLAEAGKISLSRHNYTLELTPEEKRQLVTDGQGNYFVGVSIRQ